jgi:hypothetical protein
MAYRQSILKRKRVSRRFAGIAIELMLIALIAGSAWPFFRSPGRKIWVDAIWAAIWGVAALCLMIYAITEFGMHRRRIAYNRRRGVGLCGHCAYDLRGAMSVTCPECGAYHGARPGMRLSLHAANAK